MRENNTTLGLIVNPLAGLGGRVGLKGSDGAATVARALALGAMPRAGELAIRALRRLASRLPRTPLLTGVGDMGAVAAEAAGLPCTAIGSTGATTTPDDTRDMASEMRERGVRLVLFSGGDGTARDILSVLGEAVPMLGIPAGVKMQSGVFTTSPEAAGDLAAMLLAEDPRATLRPAEVLDIDEEALRAGHIAPRLFGMATIPHERRLVQSPKARGLSGDGAVDAAAEVAAEMQPGTLYLIGPGTSAKAVLRALGLEGALLGIDAVLDGRLVGSDVGERDILGLAEGRPLHIVLGVVGGQGFLFGRGNQPITPAVIARAGRDGITVLANQEKLLALPEQALLVDTGDPEVDGMLSGFIRVRTGPRREALMRVSTTSIRD